MNKTEKAEAISEIKDLISNSTGIFLVDYHGINVEDISDIRRKFRKEGINYKVFKNTLLKRALNEIGGYDKFEENLVGMIGTIFAGENYIAPAKIIKQFNKTSEKFVFRGCYIESQYYESDKLELLASMPSKEEVIAGILSSINAPASGIVGTLHTVIRELVSVIDEVGKTKAA